MNDVEQQQAQELNSAAELQALLTAAVDAIITIDERGDIRSFNPAAEKLFGYTADEMLGTPITRLMGEPYRSAHQGYIQRYLTTGRPHIIGFGRVVEAVKKSGEVFPISLSVGDAANGATRRFVGIIRDLSKERAAERELRSLEERLTHVGRFSLMGEMAAAIAHEINQPLSAISTYAQAARRLMQAESADMEALGEACTAVTKQAKRASEVIENLRSFIRKEDVKRESVDVNRAIQDVMPLIEADAHAGRIPLRIDFEADLPRVQGDKVHLQQVLLNLTRNAVDAMCDAPSRSRGIEICTRRDGQRVEVAVTDAGPGVSPRLGEEIFHPFVTTKEEGLGVGLAISRRIIEAHGGTLTYHPSRSGGTVFVMSIPIEGESDPLDYEE